MTNEEAKARIKDFVDTYELEYRETAMMIKPKDYEAFKQAIKALEAQPTRVDETYLSVKDAISELKAMREHIVGYMSVVGTTAYDMGIEALEAQPCIEDYPTCTECEHYDSEKHYCPRFCQVIKDTLAEAQPKKDLVSKADVIHHIAEQYIQHNELVPPWLTIGDMPAVQPKKGKWIKVITNVDEWGETWHFKCSICGEKSNKGYRPLENYCHNCGAEMEVEE